jgi:hypothetical protein
LITFEINFAAAAGQRRLAAHIRGIGSKFLFIQYDSVVAPGQARRGRGTMLGYRAASTCEVRDGHCDNLSQCQHQYGEITVTV